jgi:hypothetical protein
MKTYYSSDGKIAYAVCEFCGYLSQHPSTSKDDLGAMTESENDVRRHQLKECKENPNREESETEKYIREIQEG